MVAIFMPIGILGELAVGAVPVLRSRGIRSGKQVAGYLAGVIATLLAVTAGIAASTSTRSKTSCVTPRC